MEGEVERAWLVGTWDGSGLDLVAKLARDKMVVVIDEVKGVVRGEYTCG